MKLCLERNIPFVTYRLPGAGNRVVVWVQRSGRMLFVEDIHEVAGKKGFVYAPFHRMTNFPVVFFEPEYIGGMEALEDSLISDIEAGPALYPDYDHDVPFEVGRPEYLRQAGKMISSFGPGLSKAVLSRVKCVDRPVDFEPALFFLDLVQAYPQAFCHLINIPGAGCWAGASPEGLLRIDGKLATTVALAGTRNHETGHGVPWGQKEIEEQEMVTRHIQSVLLACGIKDYTLEGPQTVRAGNVEHLSTRFSFSPGPGKFDTGSFLQQLHPTPAVSGLPKDAALDLIRDTEKHNREYYAGYCGPINYGESTELFVNLRCMKILPRQLGVFAGGGLTGLSIPADEWQETEWKAKTLLTFI